MTRERGIHILLYYLFQHNYILDGSSAELKS